ncbi:MAG: M36 family metallopeptidase [Mycobacteriales bacterium]
MRARVVLAGVAAAALVGGTAAAGAGTTNVPRPTVTGGAESLRGQTLAVHDKLADYDRRVGAIAPSHAALAEVRKLGRGLTVRWNAFGTPQVLTNDAGWLSTGLRGAPADAAREWVRTHKVLFRLTDQDVTDLELVNDAQFADSPAHAVLFRQRFAGLMSAQDGLITVGIRDGKVAIVTSSAVGHGDLAAHPAISAADAWLRAAGDVGHAALSVADLVPAGIEQTGFTLFRVPSFVQPQRARLVAFATRTEGVRPAYETIVLNVSGGHAEAYTSYVDAVTGRVWWRQNNVQQNADTEGGASSVNVPGLSTAVPPRVPTGGPFQGAYKDTPDKPACGPMHPFTVGPDVRLVVVAAQPVVAANDIVIDLYRNGKFVVEQDTLTSPEVLAYQPTGGVPAGNYAAAVCPFPGGSVSGPYDYAGGYATYDGPLVSAYSDPAKWKYFASNPAIAGSTKDTRRIGCWDIRLNPSTTKTLKDCDVALGNIAARAPWDWEPRLNAPTMTTKGNAANTAEAHLSPLTPAEQYRPISATRDYIFPWTNQWRTAQTPGQPAAGCATTTFTSQERLDVDAAAANLFTMHNQMHDFAYFLGYTERNFNSQQSNFGITSPQYENDPQVGNVQAGALDGGSPSFQGRDNANQITLNDGISPISNMYLWQPIAASFYADCVDGDFDASVIAHEYTHQISNRMVGGPDAGLSGAQSGSMGESWSDAVALEFLNETGAAGSTGEDPYSVGAYVTGDRRDGIRNYNLLINPLNYSDFGYDTTGPEVHADGEIWNGVLYRVRLLMNRRWDKQFPSTNKRMQSACARGQLAVDRCPGNRRWIQNVFDSFLIMPAAVTYLDARDSMIAADRMRTGGTNIATMWQGFAQFGLGKSAETLSASDVHPTPGFDSPVAKNARVTFRLLDATSGRPVRGQIHVGRYQARTVPVANTDPDQTPGPTAALVAGKYELFVRADGYGHTRLTRTYRPGERRTETFRLARNFASKASGAVASGVDGLYRGDLIDDNEGTDWVFTGQARVQGEPDPTTPETPIRGRSVTVQLGGGLTRVDRIQVSALHRPARAGGEVADPAQSRFSGLRQFAIDASTDGKTFRQVYVSSPSAFPGTKPRPRAPNLNLRSFRMPKPFLATHVRIRVLTNQCTGYKGFAGEQDSDPTNDTDCLAAAQAHQVQIAELQVFGSQPRRSGSSARAAARGAAAPARVPVVAARRTAAPAPGVAVIALAAVAAAGGALAVHRVR